MPTTTSWNEFQIFSYFHEREPWPEVEAVLPLFGVIQVPDTSTRTDTTVEDSHQSRVRRELNELKARVSTFDWDKEGARPLESSTFEAAGKFVSRLSLRNTGLPEIDATPQGEIVFSWDSEDWSDSFDVAVLPSGGIAVGGIFERLEIKGDVGFDHKSITRICDMARWTGLASGKTN